MDFGNFIDGIKILRKYEQLPNNVLSQEIKFFTKKVKSVNTFTNFSEYSVEGRVATLLSYMSDQLKVKLDVDDPFILYQFIRFFLAQCLRGEYYIDFSTTSKTENQNLITSNLNLAKFILLSNEHELELAGNNRNSLLLNIVNYIETSVKTTLGKKNNKVTFEGPYSEFSNQFDILIRAKRIGAISIEYDIDSHALLEDLLDLAKKKKSFFCNVSILFNLEDFEHIVKLKDYFSNYVKLLKVNQSLILNTQLG